MRTFDRRQFIAGCGAGITAGAVAALGLTGCATVGPVTAPGRVDVGLLSNYALDGVNDRFAHSEGIMMVTFGGRLVAMSAVCPHDGAILNTSKEQFHCPVDGSEFDRSGNAIVGPARDPLLRYVLWLGSDRHVTVDRSRPLIQPLWGRNDAYLVARVG